MLDAWQGIQGVKGEPGEQGIKGAEVLLKMYSDIIIFVS